MPAVKALEERGRALAEALSVQDVLAYRGAIDTGAMLDTLLALHEELNDRPFVDSPNVAEFIERYRAAVDDVRSWRLGKNDFDFVRTLARGQFGIVDIVRSKHNRGVYAMKTLNKRALLSQREQAAFLEERDVLVLGRDSPWIPDLYASFQDRENLYIVMEFVAGGDLFSMLDRCENAVIDEDAARFYAAELVLALEDLHKIGYIHRDCKPQNTLLDARGHVKLADFGSCARIDAHGAHEAKTSVPVGTCDYIAPETLRARELGNGGLVSESCDWWSLGAVLYEMLYGDPPFYSDSVPETYGKIMSCEKHLSFDDMADVSDDAKDLMRRLLARQEDRLGLDAIKAHPFFASVDWATIRLQEAPFVPRISSPDDTSNFSVGDETAEDVGMAAARASSSRLGHGREYAGEQLPFIGFTHLPPAFAQGAKRAAAQTPRGPRDDPALMRVLRTKIDQIEAAAASSDIRWREQQARWTVERRLLEEKVKALEAQALAAPPPPPPPQRRESAVQTESEEAAEDEPPPRDAEAQPLGAAVAGAYQQLATQLVSSLEEQLGGQSAHLAQLVGAVNQLAAATGAKLEESLQAQLQAQKKELAALAQLVQASLSATAATAPATAAPATNDSPRLTSVATLSQAYQALGGSPARLSVGSTTAVRGARRSISAVEDATLGSHPKSVVATLVNEAPSDTDQSAAGPPDSRRRSLAATPSTSRLARVERRASAGVPSDALSAVGAKCDRLTVLFEQQAAELGGIQRAQASLLAVCNELRLSLPAADTRDVEDADGSRRGRRKTEQLRRHALGPFSAGASQDLAADTSALELLKASTDELIASLRAQLATSEGAREAAEARATELLGWIGRESKGRALLEDMIRTAQQACKMVEDKLESMMKDTDELRSSVVAKDEEISSLAAIIDTREKELRNLRRASRKALDQLADLQTAQQKQQESGGPDGSPDRSLEDLDSEIKEAAAVHVRLQFEISRLEGDVSRLESEKAQLAKDMAHRDRRLREAEAKLRAASTAAVAAAETDGIRVRGFENEEDEDKKFGSIGTKSHKRFKVQIQNMQKHIEYLEMKLALATSENDVLKQQQPSAAAAGHGMRFPGFARTASATSNGAQPATTAMPQPATSAKLRPMSTMFPNLHSNLDATASTASLHTDVPSESVESNGSGLGSAAGTQQRRRVPTDPQNGTRPRNESLSASFERIRSPFKGFRKHFS
ncbi:Serine/threonine-protein kinase MRCK beta [Coemansia biformis]|uniref:non-specific serine/threonine protein kinase n=1 Tax=Coemansia biformis TaxID=1286918 RepID=A0A9W8CXR2_9FUNG|nr:Serine/threonine-protein kinase MRCK beta [Coemansia biformis]